MKPVLHVVRLPRVGTLAMLRLEEILLDLYTNIPRTEASTVPSFLLLNQSPVGERCIAMGISGKKEELINIENAKADGIQVRCFCGLTADAARVSPVPRLACDS